MNCHLPKYTTHQFTYFIYYSHQDKLKIQESKKSNKHIRSYQQNMIEFLDKFVQYTFHLNFQSKPGFLVNPCLNAFISPARM